MRESAYARAAAAREEEESFNVEDEDDLQKIKDEGLPELTKSEFSEMSSGSGSDASSAIA